LQSLGCFSESYEDCRYPGGQSDVAETVADLEADNEGVKQDDCVVVAVVGNVRWAYGVEVNVTDDR
jgi:hypothetical protein